MSWEDWCESFEAYLKAIGEDVIIAKNKFTMVKYSLGIEGMMVKRTLRGVRNQEDGAEENSDIEEESED
ncbi:hypothetical protein NDU88_006092 [Pleurodeles waltl]|uniref:Uncharacterized protein n=1 Tax=Pleurodeles waltl TaxID=8319 RepID=A0AAV7WCY3_PLEWA|nr:hypothetical protein NDU88_006092 [Pleurodeles waltl]